MADPARARRLAKRILAIVASELEHEVKDPRLKMVTVTDASVTGDLREATVYYTVFGDDDDRASSAVALESSRGVLRSAVGRHTGIKFTPTLAFSLDTVGEQSRHMTELLAKARKSDAAIAAGAVGADYAGEANPYRDPLSEEQGSDGEGPVDGG